MKLCAVCNRTCPDAEATCPACGEASWIEGAKDEPPCPESAASPPPETVESAPVKRTRIKRW